MIYFFVSSLAIAVLMFLLRRRLTNLLLSLVFLTTEVVLGIYVANPQGVNMPEYFHTDPLASLLYLTLIPISMAVFYHSFVYMARRPSEIRRESRYAATLVLLITSIIGALFTTNIILLWIWIEATTVFMTILTYYERSELSLEAAWKYLYIASVALAIAFVGILALTAGFSASDLSLSHMDLTQLKQYIPNVDPAWLKISFLFLLVGFSVKLEAFPFYPVCIDALSFAPSPVSALMSTALMNVGFIALFRICSLMSESSIFPWIRSVLLITGMISLLLSATQMYKVKYLTRMLAFSSLEHIGIILICLSLGEAGYYAAILHLILHSFIKSSLFLQTDQIQAMFKTNRLSKMANYLRSSSLGGLVLLLGFVGIAAIPPSGLFISEYLMIKALVQDHSYLTLGMVLVLLLVIVYALGKRFLDILFTPQPLETAPGSSKTNPWHSFFPFLFLLIASVIGFATPQFIIDLIDRSIAAF